MTVGKGLKVNLFASEKEFPDLAKPVQMSFDTKGRLWVAVLADLSALEAQGGDERQDPDPGRHRRRRQGRPPCTVFADRPALPDRLRDCATAACSSAQAPDLMLLKDTNGDDQADCRERVISGLDSADTHHTSNSFRLDPGGALYFQEGTFHHSQVETPYGPPVRLANAGVFRYEPRTQKFEVYVTYGFANPHGHVVRPLGPGLRDRRHGQRQLLRHGVLGPPRVPREAPPYERHSSPSAPAPAPAPRSSPAGTFPRTGKVTTWWPT